ncbi:hypothetical protein CHF27_008155 [Romboutsia maritimum]|uniref:Uncharacterized protein n=1 Tax=Romboutsia maritimum TaxID=2020948 RepID=A0A371ISL8_9FIRM|nr:hypothetical protein [Romboutsia maritimum]RDY23453.1 hypothetical protein CHF27_008155 [Romboutsia maritimum]
MNINIIYIYPKIIEVNKEINLLRIIDKKIKETIVFYAIKKNSFYEIYIINTMLGNYINICNVSNEKELNSLISRFKGYEKEIKEINDLCIIEKYILNLIKK